jgi:hypothetical protein
MSSKKPSSTKSTIGVKLCQRLKPRKRPGRHAKKKRPMNQTFFTNGPCR